MSTVRSPSPQPSGNMPLHEMAVHLHPSDNVAIAKVTLQPGTILTWEPIQSCQRQSAVRQTIPPGHKIALQRIDKGQPVRRYGQLIGFATKEIQPGDHVHTHNLGLGPFNHHRSFGAEVPAAIPARETEPRTFLGYRRADGRVATRNTIAVLSTVNCSAHACLEIAHHFTPERLSAYPNVDGVIALTAQGGCTAQPGGDTLTFLQRTLAGMVKHPNVGSSVLVGLGCETNQASALIKDYGLDKASTPTPLVLNIQEAGGTGPAIEAGIAGVAELLPRVNDIVRTPQPISQLMMALQCGGSDGWSGVTANPIVGLVADELIRQGGTAVLGETPEIYGAEQLLSRRAIRHEVGRALEEQVRWWENHAIRLGTEIDNNPSPGNKAGGLTTIYEKALGAITKSGSMPLMAVYGYAEPLLESGLVFMNTPGFDSVSVTGQVAAGCNLVLFTTGRGSTFGSRAAPTIKIASTTALYQQMRGDMDFDAGRVLTGSRMESLAAELLDLIIAVASGQPSKSEAQGIGEAEFNPWQLGDTL